MTTNEMEEELVVGKENDRIIVDFLFEDYKKKMKEKDEEQAMELMCRHFEFYE